MSTLVLWSANSHGYTVHVLARGQMVEEYVVGNCRQDSQVIVDPGDPAALTKQELRGHALRSAQEFATKYSTGLIEEEEEGETEVPPCL